MTNLKRCIEITDLKDMLKKTGEIYGNKPAYKLRIDFGEFGVKNSSAQITDLYQPEDLIGKQVIAVINFEPIKISQVKSEVRVLGADTEGGVVLLNLDEKVENGAKIY